jgi:hypothetical protein
MAPWSQGERWAEVMATESVVVGKTGSDVSAVSRVAGCDRPAWKHEAAG